MPDLKKMLTLEALSEALPSWLKRSTKPEYNADEIDSTLTTNQFVSASDKDNWNAKGTYSKPSGGIPKSDLSSIVQTSLEKADSALQSETDPTVPSWAKQSSKPSYTQDEVPDGTTYKRVTQTEKNTWNGKQNALSTTQMNAVNSGITSAKVTQISTNQTNIEYLTPSLKSKRYVCSTTDYEQCSDVAITVPVGKTIQFTANLKFNNSPPRGIQVRTGTDLSNLNQVVGIQEITQNYSNLSVTGLYTNTSSSQAILYIYVKSNSVTSGGNDVVTNVFRLN